MKLLQKIINKFNGLHYPQEYLCLANGMFEQPLHAYLVCNGQVIKDVTTQHAFVGYHPLILALRADDAGREIVDIVFSNRLLQLNESFSQKDAIATLRLKKIKEDPFQHTATCLYEGVHGRHHFVSSFHQYIIGLNNRLFNKKKGNVFLHDNLYKQVQIAYALPRNISLVTVAGHNSFNLFPTDLHGPLNGGKYLVSLRFSGKACHQVENASSILLTAVDSNFYKTVYALGKNHMQDMKTKDNFPFSGAVSAQLQLPIPESAVSYRELELEESFIYGIHKIMRFRELSRHRVNENFTALVHIHNCYATWRNNNQLPGNYLLR